MSLRQKLLLLFSLTIAAAVAAVAWTVLVRIRQVFDQQDQEKTALLVNQFQREFQHRAADVASAVDRLANAERVRGMALELAQSSDTALYLTEAQALAAEAQVDFLEVVGPDGNIVSSAQWPARFGYAEVAVNGAGAQAFLKREDLPDGESALGVFAVRPVRGAPSVRIVGGKRLDPQFLADLPTQAGVEAYLYSGGDAAADVAADVAAPTTASPNQLVFDPKLLLGIGGAVANGPRYQPLIDAARRSGQPSSSIVYLTDRRDDSVSATVLPLKSAAGRVMAVLVVAASRRPMVETQQHIRAIAYGVAATGILLAIGFSVWIAGRVSRPIEELARAAEEVAQGNWDARVEVRSRDEVGTLARSFNHMTGELAAQREKLIQSERVAAWRELARRLAHELKNPLFPLQLTVENLIRARGLPEQEFDEVFRESTRTLGMEIANLKTIIGRFSDFSKMSRPQLERIDAATAITRVALLYFPWKGTAAEECDVTSAGEQKIDCCMVLDAGQLPIDADPEMLHRALSNLVLNAMDAMPDGGKLTLSARCLDDRIEIRVADTGEGLTPEECERLFTPYYTTKQHGTGLGLAIVQSVVADHAGTISVESQPGGGAAFVLLFPRAASTDEDEE
jgi:two-component system, NtrC family, nitrogen regulation sensor histidine kinase NtrY